MNGAPTGPQHHVGVGMAMIAYAWALLRDGDDPYVGVVGW